MGKRYSSLADIKFTTSGFDHDLEDPVPSEQQLVDSLSYTPHATSNSVELYPLTKRGEECHELWTSTASG
jgi:hypothetical protein